MRSRDIARRPDTPQERVNQVLSEVFGTDVDLLSEAGRESALRTLDAFSPDQEGQEGELLDLAEALPADDSRTAWEAARGVCAEVQIGAALQLLGKLKPLPDRDDEVLPANQYEDFDGLKDQIEAELKGLRDEMRRDADSGAISNIFGTLFSKSDGLFDSLRNAGNYSDEHVGTLEQERAVIDYLAIRAFAGELCAFPLRCGKPATEPENEGTRLGQLLHTLSGRIRCIGNVARDVIEELSDMGISETCVPSRIPGVEFERYEDQPEKSSATGKQAQGQPSLVELFTLLRRSSSESDRWLDALARHGKGGVASIGREIDRLADKARHFKPVLDGENTPKVAYMLDLLVSAYCDASNELN